MNKKIRIGMKVRTPDGQKGKVVDQDSKTNRLGVCVETQRLWELRWFREDLLKVTK